MIENWVNWEIWAKGALCSRGGWLLGGCSRLVGGVSCALVVRSLASPRPSCWAIVDRYGLQSGGRSSGPRCLQRKVRLYRYRREQDYQWGVGPAPPGVRGTLDEDLEDLKRAAFEEDSSCPWPIPRLYLAQPQALANRRFPPPVL
jgi:hypothetical protein